MEANDSQVTLTVTESEKDLGVKVERNLQFSNYTEIASNKANLLRGMIRHSFSYMDADMVRPHPEYGNTVWSPWYAKDMQLEENV